jgi:hypothetical protein
VQEVFQQGFSRAFDSWLLEVCCWLPEERVIIEPVHNPLSCPQANLILHRLGVVLGEVVNMIATSGLHNALVHNSLAKTQRDFVAECVHKALAVGGNLDDATPRDFWSGQYAHSQLHRYSPLPKTDRHTR